MEVPMATPQTTIDQAKQEAFVHKVLGDTSATMTTLLASIGDRLGLFKDLAVNGPATSAEVAKRTGTNERYVREWLGGMTTAKYRYIESGFVKEFHLATEDSTGLAIKDNFCIS